MQRLSTDALSKDFYASWYQAWMSRLDLENALHHAKFWEQAMLYEGLKRNGMLTAGKSGIGFGVGEEHLVSVFANEGAKVTATDQAPEDAALAWDNGQLAKGKESLFFKKLIDRKTFDANVTFEHYDMNKLNRSYTNKFDFAWSNCVIGHLGSMKASEKHLVQHAGYIKYGGVSILTTELNISSLTETVTDNSGTIIWRLSDLYRLFNTMLEHDMVASRFRLRLTSSPSDYYIYYDIDDLIPAVFLTGGATRDKYQADITKIPFSNYAIVQVQLVFKKRHLTAARKLLLKQVYRNDFVRNTRKLRKFIHSHGDITDYSTRYRSTDLPVTPETANKRITLRPGEVKQLSVSFVNGSKEPFFSYGLHTPLHVPPLVLSTAEPVNRDSKLYTKTWFSNNRPAVAFTPVYNEAEFRTRCHGQHRALPGDRLTYTFDIAAPRKAGKYTEEFCLVLEGMGDLPASKLTLHITVA